MAPGFSWSNPDNPGMTDVQDGIRESLAALTVDMNDLVPYPGNPRHGHLVALAQGLATYGQYKPLVVQASTRHILVGNQTYHAARQLHWTRIAAAMIDVDDDTARRIVTFDNRANELGSYDGQALAELLTSLEGNLEGTGYSVDDLDHLLADLRALTAEAAGAVNDPGGGNHGEALPPLAGDAEAETTDVLYRLAVECDDRDTETALLEQFLERGYAVNRIFADSRAPDARVKVKLQPDAHAPNEPVPAGQRAGVEIHPALRGLQAPTGDLETYPGNPRRGDVEAIKASLQRFGQYRPIVARRIGRTGQVLAGNHTLIAARELGWSHIAVTWVEATDDEALRIVAWDNRSSDLGRTDEAELARLLETLPDLGGTGYGRDELDGILQRAAAQEPPLYGVLIECFDEEDQIFLLTELQGEPQLRVRAILT